MAWKFLGLDCHKKDTPIFVSRRCNRGTKKISQERYPPELHACETGGASEKATHGAPAILRGAWIGFLSEPRDVSTNKKRRRHSPSAHLRAHGGGACDPWKPSRDVGGVPPPSPTKEWTKPKKRVTPPPPKKKKKRKKEEEEERQKGRTRRESSGSPVVPEWSARFNPGFPVCTCSDRRRDEDGNTGALLKHIDGQCALNQTETAGTCP